MECEYCTFAGHKVQDVLSFKEVTEILEAAKANGLNRVHWTGGEPTTRKDFADIVKAAKEIGFTEQIITTNGSRLYAMMDECVANGLSRVIVSLDTFDPERNFKLTKRPFLQQTLKSIEEAVRTLPSLTKISAVMMNSTLPELPRFVSYAQELNSKGDKGKLAVKLNQFFPSNPAQLAPGGQLYWVDEFIPERKILEGLEKIGKLTPVDRKTLPGDNPSYNYYLVGDTGVHVGVLTLFSREYPCGRCHKLRIQPTGSASVCLNMKTPVQLNGLSIAEKTQAIREAMAYREQLDIDMPKRQHYRPQLGECRFGKQGEPVPMGQFYELLRRCGKNAI
jgi:cyclic pyranopterin phosphate synthase